MVEKEIDALIKPYIDDQSILGTAVALLQNGELIYANGFGVTAVAENGVPVSKNTLFAYGSISKTLCSILILRLMEQGLLDLEKPIVDYLPNLRFSNDEYGRQITLRHILSHTTGLPMGGKYWGPREPESLGEFVHEQIPRYTFLSEPGTCHLYSNTVFCIAGHVAEAVTGTYYDALMQEYVFDPLNMTKATFDPVVALTYPVALAHERDDDDRLYTYHNMPYNVSGNPSSFAYGRIMDLANVAQMMVNDGEFGGTRFLKSATLAEMKRPCGNLHIEGSAHPFSTMNLAYGLGLQVGHYKNFPSARHGGMNLSNNCFFDLFPKEGAGVLVLTNYSDDASLMAMLCSLYDYVLNLPQKGIIYRQKPATRQLTKEQLSAYCGTFLNVEMGDLVTFERDNDQLVLKREDDRRPLVPFGKAQFYAEISDNYRQIVTFVAGESAGIAFVMVSGMPYHPIHLDEQLQPNFELWRTFAGTYRDPSNRNKDEQIIVQFVDNALHFTEDGELSIGRAVHNAGFLTHLGLVEFEQDQDEGYRLVVGKATRFFRL